MKKIKNILVTLTAIIGLHYVTASAQTMVTPDSGGSGGTTSTKVAQATSVAIPFDPAAMTNRPALAAHVSQYVEWVSVDIYNMANVKQGDEPSFSTVIPYNDSVKSFTGIEKMLKTWAFGIQVFDTTQPTWVSLGLDFGKRDVNAKGGGSYQTLMYGNNWYGNMVKSGPGDNDPYVLDAESSKLRLSLPYNILMKRPGLLMAKILWQQNGRSMRSEKLDVSANGEFWFPSGAAGAGVIIEYGDFGHGLQTEVYSMYTGNQVGLKSADIRVLFTGSDDVIPMNEAPRAIDKLLFSYYFHAIVPLWEIDTKVAASFPMLVHTTEDIWAREYTVINRTTKEVTHFPVFNEKTPTIITLKPGVNQITTDIPVKSPFGPAVTGQPVTPGK